MSGFHGKAHLDAEPSRETIFFQGPFLRHAPDAIESWLGVAGRCKVELLVDGGELIMIRLTEIRAVWRSWCESDLSEGKCLCDRPAALEGAQVCPFGLVDTLDDAQESHPVALDIRNGSIFLEDVAPLVARADPEGSGLLAEVAMFAWALVKNGSAEVFFPGFGGSDPSGFLASGPRDVRRFLSRSGPQLAARTGTQATWK